MISKTELLKKVESLPALPIAVTRISQLLGNKRASLNDYETAIKPDTALTGNLLRIANSAFFKQSQKIVSVRQAINMLGEKRIFEIAMTAAFSRVIPKVISGYNVPAKDFWLHNIAVAILSENLAKHLDIKNQEMVFTVGLMHDIGKLVLGSFLANHDSEVLQRIEKQQISLVNAEKEVLGVDHMEIGEEVAKKWNLPESIILGIKWHHNPGDMPDHDDMQTLVDIVHIGNCLSHIIGFGVDIGELSRNVDSSVTDRLDFDIQILERITSDSISMIEEMGSLFNPDNGGK